VPGPWTSTIVLGEALRLAASAEQQKALLPGIAAGEVKGAVALLMPGSSTPAGAPATASGGALSGRLEMVEYAHVADSLLVGADDGLYLVDPKGAGVTISRHETLDRTSRLTTVVLDGAAGDKLEGGSPEVVQDLLDRAAVLVANELVGIARFSLNDTVEYDKTRVQFGKPVGSFQALKHELADLHMATVMAEHAGLYAAYAADSDAHDKQLAASIAKAKATEVAFDVTGAMIQFHGGIGYTWEHHAHFYFKRANRLQHTYGDASQHRERVARLRVDAAQSADMTGVEATVSGAQGAGVPAGATAS
jgi:acyl-CoA dehydrogenase